jgi:hypothetical protein
MYSSLSLIGRTNIMSEKLNRFLDPNYSSGELIYVKELTRGDWVKLGLYIGEVRICEKWVNPKTPDEKVPRKGTGGKRAYIRVYVNAIEKCGANRLTKGFMIEILRFVQWDTNYLVNKRTNKKLNIKEIARLLKSTYTPIYDCVKDATKHSLLIECDDGYKLNTNYMGKGVSK